MNDQIRNPWIVSITAHVIALLALGATIASNYRREMQTVRFQLIAQTKTPLAVSDGRSVPTVDQQPKAKRVSGISRKAVQSDTNPLETKQGNTLAKAADSEVLEKDDPNALPATVDEFLVNQMPKLLSEVRVEYPEQAKKRGVQGVVVLDLLIDDTGRVRDVVLIDGPGYGMNEAAVSAVRGFRFHPATSQEGKPVAVRIRYGYRFVLER